MGSCCVHMSGFLVCVRVCRVWMHMYASARLPLRAMVGVTPDHSAATPSFFTILTAASMGPWYCSLALSRPCCSCNRILTCEYVSEIDQGCESSRSIPTVSTPKDPPNTSQSKARTHHVERRDDEDRLRHARAEPRQQPPLRVQLPVRACEHRLVFDWVFILLVIDSD